MSAGRSAFARSDVKSLCHSEARAAGLPVAALTGRSPRHSEELTVFGATRNLSRDASEDKSAATSLKATGVTRFLLLALRAYQACLSPLMPSACKFYPTCSQYAVEAVTRFGARRGAWLALKRLLRCRPFSHGGFDPVPDLPCVDRSHEASLSPQSEEFLR